MKATREYLVAFHDHEHKFSDQISNARFIGDDNPGQDVSKYSSTVGEGQNSPDQADNSGVNIEVRGNPAADPSDFPIPGSVNPFAHLLLSSL